MKCKLGFIASAVAGGLVEGGEERVGAHACGGGGEAILLGMGHRHTGHDVFLWVLSHDDGLSTVGSCADLFSGDQLLFLKPDLWLWVTLGPPGSCCPGDKIQHPRMLGNFLSEI